MLDLLDGALAATQLNHHLQVRECRIDMGGLGRDA